MHFSNLCLAAGLAALSMAAPAKEKRGSKLEFFGVNESGAEFGTAIPGVYNTDYTWYTLSTYDTFIAQGMNTFRLNFMMERMAQKGLSGALDPYYLGNLTQQVNYITSKGAYAMINPHNYGRFNGAIITDTAGFQTFWKNLATPYKGNSKVIFDTMNEFNTMSSAQVVSLNQAAINGIRAAGATSQYITPEGNAWTGAWTWTTATGTDGLTNAQTMGSLTDPQNKLIYQMHQYLDSDGSGSHTDCVNTTIGSSRLVAATNWLRQNKKTGLIGEYAGGVNATCEAAVKDMLSYMDKNDDVWKGALWWAAGPWWGNTWCSLEPTSGPAYSTYVPILKQ